MRINTPKLRHAIWNTVSIVFCLNFIISSVDARAWQVGGARKLDGFILRNAPEIGEEVALRVSGLDVMDRKFRHDEIAVPMTGSVKSDCRCLTMWAGCPHPAIVLDAG